MGGSGRAGAMTGPPDPSESDNLDRIAAVENHATLYREQYQNQFLEDSMKEAQRETQTDNRGNPFIEVDNLRVTCVLVKPSSKRWAKGVKLYLRVQGQRKCVISRCGASNQEPAGPFEANICNRTSRRGTYREAEEARMRSVVVLRAGSYCKMAVLGRCWAMRDCHSAGPVVWTLVPKLSTATVTGMSTTSNS